MVATTRHLLLKPQQQDIRNLDIPSRAVLETTSLLRLVTLPRAQQA